MVRSVSRNRLIDPQFELEMAERLRMFVLAAKLAKGRFLLTCTTIAAVVVVLGAALLALGRSSVVQSQYGGAILLLSKVAVCLILVWLAVVSVPRSLLGPAVRRAARDMGFDVCLRCGAKLESDRSQTNRCPTCGLLLTGEPRHDAHPKQERLNEEAETEP